MNIAAITRFKHGMLFKALQKLGWSQKLLAEKAGIHPATLGDYINLRKRPSEAHATKIEVALGEAGIVLDVFEAWPEGFTLHPLHQKVVRNADVPVELLPLDHAPEVLQLEMDTSAAAQPEFEYADVVQQALKDLLPHHRMAIKLKYLEDCSIEEIAKRMGVTTKVVVSIIAMSKRRLAEMARIKTVWTSLQEKQGIDPVLRKFYVTDESSKQFSRRRCFFTSDSLSTELARRRRVGEEYEKQQDKQEVDEAIDI